MKRPQRMFTKDEILRLYELRQQGKTWQEIADDLGRVTSAVALSYKYLERALDKKIRGQHGTYVSAVKIIKKQSPVKSNGQQEQATLPTTDNLERLDLAFQNFQKELVEVLDSEVLRRVGDTMKEVRELRLKVQEYDETWDKMKNSNWIDSLRSKWTA